MSQYADHCSTLRSKIIEHGDNYKIVIDVFLDTVGNQDWEYSTIISMLKCSMGISNKIDEELKRQISLLNIYL